MCIRYSICIGKAECHAQRHFVLVFIHAARFAAGIASRLSHLGEKAFYIFSHNTDKGGEYSALSPFILLSVLWILSPVSARRAGKAQCRCLSLIHIYLVPKLIHAKKPQAKKPVAIPTRVNYNKEKTVGENYDRT